VVKRARAFNHDLSSYLSTAGTYTVDVRAQDYDGQVGYIYSDWYSTTFYYDGGSGSVTITGYGNDPSVPSVYGTVLNAGAAVSGAQYEVDIDGDGTVEDVGFADGSGAFTHDLSSYLYTAGTYTVDVRAQDYDVQGGYIYSDWYSTTFYYDGGGQYLTAATDRSSGSSRSVTDAKLSLLIDAAVEQWAAVRGEASRVQLDSVNVQIADLVARRLGVAYTADNSVVIDIDGDGAGWFIDETPFTSEEFVSASTGLASDAGDRYDLLTVVLTSLDTFLASLISSLRPTTSWQQGWMLACAEQSSISMRRCRSAGQRHFHLQRMQRNSTGRTRHMMRRLRTLMGRICCMT